MNERGFTVLELLVVITFLVIAGSVFLVQKRDVEIAGRDAQRKTALNAMYYNLEEVYFKANNSYPRTISSQNLKAMDPTLFADPQGKKVNEQGSDYRYEPTGCAADSCRGYTLRADLEKESDFSRTSQRN